MRVKDFERSSGAEGELILDEYRKGKTEGWIESGLQETNTKCTKK